MELKVTGRGDDMNATAKKAYVKCWNCNQPATHVMTRQGSNTLHACDYCTRIDRAEAESRGWIVTPLAVTVREQAQTKAAEMAAKLTDEALRIAWMATETQPVTEELALVRGWLMDELNKRLGDDLFDEWLMAPDAPNPLAYFTR
jgi:hypothetical protein